MVVVVWFSVRYMSFLSLSLSLSLVAAVDGEMGGEGLNGNTEEMDGKKYYWDGNPINPFVPHDYWIHVINFSPHIE